MRGKIGAELFCSLELVDDLWENFRSTLVGSVKVLKFCLFSEGSLWMGGLLAPAEEHSQVG